MDQHKKSIKDEKWRKTGLKTSISNHVNLCNAGFDWNNVKTLKVEARRFQRKVREALEIQLQNTAPRTYNIVNMILTKMLVSM